MNTIVHYMDLAVMALLAVGAVAYVGVLVARVVTDAYRRHFGS